DDPHKNLQKLALLMYDITPHSAACERVFSTLGWIYNKNRLRLAVSKVEVEEEQENQIENLSDKWVCDICLDYIDKKKHYSYLTCLDPKCKMVSHLVCLAQIFLRCERNKNIKKFEDILGNNSNITNSDICQKIDTYYLLPKYGNYVNSYQKELVQQQNHIDRMVQQGYNEYDVKKQKEVLDETVQMIPDCKNRLNEAYKVLKDLVV
ncbi:6727_t:CDS:2, partial [Entrophospora sp. SA101]